MNDLNQNKETVDAPIAEAVNEQPVPAKKGAYMWRAILIPTLGLHWLLTVVFIAVGFLVFCLLEFLDKQFGVNLPGEFFEIIFCLLCSVLMIWLDIRLGRDLVLKTKVPNNWVKRWVPLLAYPLFTLIVAAACMVWSDGFWKRDCWGVYGWINIYAIVLIIMATFTGTPWLLFLSNLGCFVPYILSFAFYQRRLKGLEPMPKGMRVALWMVILACAGAFGYGFYERSQNLIEPVSRHEHGSGGHGFGYEGGWSSVDLSPYYPWTQTNLLAKLDEPSTLTLTNKIVWDGAEALYPLYAAFARSVLPESILPRDVDEDVDDEISWKMPEKSGVEFHNTIEGFTRLVKQKADIVFNAAPSASQKEEARRANAELTYTPIALEAFVFFVNKECPIDGLTSQQIRDIYSGKIRDWKELGAPAGRILAFQRPPNSGSQTTMERFMGETPLAKPLKEEVVRSMGSIIERVAQYRDVANAIGYSFRYYASTMKGSDSIKFLKVDGVAPTPENIASRRYPMTGEVLAITSQHSDPDCAKLIEWILGPQGQELVEKTGYIPINKQEKHYGKPSE